MLLLIDGFDTYGNTVGVAPSPAGVVGRRYDFSGSVLDTNMYIRAGRLTAYSLELPTAASYISIYNRTTHNTVTLGFAAYLVTLASTGQLLVAFLDGTAQGIGLYANTDGSMTLKRGTSTTLGSTSAGVFSTGSWKYIELQVKVGTSTNGTYELRVNGVNVLSSSGANTQVGTNAYYGGFYIRGGSFHSIRLDDLYFLDGSGGNNTTFLGNVRVDTMFPTGDTATVQFTPSTPGTHSTLVDESVASGTDYVEDTVTGHEDLYNYTTAPYKEDQFFGVQVTTECCETDANSYSLITTCQSGSTHSEDTAQAIGTPSYVLKYRILETDPNTGSLWTKSAVSAAQYGFKVG
jgi:hypothetical protein